MFFETTVDAVDANLVNEIFGPVTAIARYQTATMVTDVTRALKALPASLTASLHVGRDEDQLVEQLTSIVSSYAGRILFDGFPPGVAVSWAQTHGGPWPSTNSSHTSVGATAIRRFLRPLTYQNAPSSVLPIELRDGYTQIPRRMDGELQPASDA